MVNKFVLFRWYYFPRSGWSTATSLNLWRLKRTVTFVSIGMFFIYTIRHSLLPPAIGHGGLFWILAGGVRSTAACGICGDEVARALARARVLEVFDCVDSIDAPHHDVCVVDGGLALWGVGVTLVEVPVAADDVTLTTHTTIVVKGAWFECLVLMCSFWRGELRDRFATCCFGHRVVEGCY